MADEFCMESGEPLLCVRDDPEYTTNDCDFAADGIKKEECKFWQPEAAAAHVAAFGEPVDLRAEIATLRAEVARLRNIDAITLPKDPRYPHENRPLITNEMKAACIGEFFTEEVATCPECDGDEADMGCEICHGHGYYTYKKEIPWTTVKDIYKAMVAAALTTSAVAVVEQRAAKEE